MNTNLATLRQLDDQQDVMAVVRASIMPNGASQAELEFYVAWCRLRQVDPVSQAFVIKQGGRLVPGVTIAGMRAIAQRTGRYGPQDGPYWMDDAGDWFNVWTDDTPPTAARVGVKQTDWDDYTYGVATWREFGAAKAQQSFSPWKTQPANMLAIRAEANALRRAFPADLAGMYTKEELGEQREEQVDTDTGEITNEPIPIKGKKMSATQAQKIARLLQEADIQGEAKNQLLASCAGTTDYKRITEDGARKVITELERVLTRRYEAQVDDEMDVEDVEAQRPSLTEADWELIDASEEGDER